MTNKTLAQKAKDEQGEKRDGDLVLKEQKLHPAFTHVSEIWVKKTLTFEEIIKKAQDFQKRVRDYEGFNLSQFNAKGSGSLYIGGKEVVPSEHSLGQFGSMVGVPGGYLNFLRTDVPELFRDTVNKLTDRSKNIALDHQRAVDAARAAGAKKPSRPDHADRKVFIRALDNGFGNSETLRAVLSSRYAVINNLPVLETLGDIVPGGRVSHLDYDGDTLRANILVPDSLRQENDSDYGGGISVLNNETGRFPLTSRPFVFRAICMNGNIWDRKDGVEFNRRHIGTVTWAELRKLLVMNIQNQIPLVQKNIEKVLNLKGLPVSEQEIQQAIVYVGRRERLTQKVQRSWWEGYETEPFQSAFGLIQGLTRGAQTQEFETRELMETLSARLIDGNFDKTLSAARNAISADEAKEVLGA